MSPNSDFTRICPRLMAKQCKTRQHQGYRARSVQRSTSTDDTIRRNDLVVLLNEGQFEDASNDFPHAVNSPERSQPVAHTDGRATPIPTFRSAVVTPNLTARSSARSSARPSARVMSPLDLSAMEARPAPAQPEQELAQPEQRDVLLGKGGYTKNPGNAAVTEFCSRFHMEYKTLKSNKEKDECTLAALAEFGEQGRKFWVKNGQSWERAPDDRVKQYFKRKICEGIISPQEREAKRLRIKKKFQNTDGDPKA